MDAEHLAKDFASKEQDAQVLYTFVLARTPCTKQPPIIQRYIHEGSTPDRVMRYGELGLRITKWCRSLSLSPTREDIDRIVREFDRHLADRQ